MNLTKFTTVQKAALLDLAVLAMYADGHLGLKEDERIHRLLSSIGVATEIERDQQFDLSISRVSLHSKNAASVRDHATHLAKIFSNGEQRLEVAEILGDLINSDNKVSPQESSFLSLVRAALKG